MKSEPLMIIIGGGTVLIQALLQLWNAFIMAHPVTATQQAAIMTVAGIILPLIARNSVTPMATLPPGVAGQIADAKAVAAAEKDNMP